MARQKRLARAWNSETGLGTMVSLGLVAMVIGVAAIAIQLVFLSSSQTRLQQTVEAIALASADAKLGLIGNYPCDLARQLAEANVANLYKCRIVGFVVHLELSSNALGIVQYARASAGPKNGP